MQAGGAHSGGLQTIAPQRGLPVTLWMITTSAAKCRLSHCESPATKYGETVSVTSTVGRTTYCQLNLKGWLYLNKWTLLTTSVRPGPAILLFSSLPQYWDLKTHLAFRKACMKNTFSAKLLMLLMSHSPEFWMSGGQTQGWLIGKTHCLKAKTCWSVRREDNLVHLSTWLHRQS